MFFWSASVLPMAVPVAVLFAGIMVFGNLAESKEFAAAKSSGASFYRLMRPILLALALISSGMFFVSNNIIPIANFKGENLLINIAKQRPTFNLIPGIFFGGIDGYSIKIGRKRDNEVFDVIIYDNKERGKGNHSLITAPKGQISYSEGSHWMEFTLYNGHSFQDYESEKKRTQKRQPFLESNFDKMLIRLDMGDYAMGDLYKVSRSDEYNMLNINQLNFAIQDLFKKYRKTIFNNNE